VGLLNLLSSLVHFLFSEATEREYQPMKQRQYQNQHNAQEDFAAGIV